MNRQELIYIFGYCLYRAEQLSVSNTMDSHRITEGVYEMLREHKISWEEISTGVRKTSTGGFTLKFDLPDALIQEADDLFEKLGWPSRITAEIMES